MSRSLAVSIASIILLVLGAAAISSSPEEAAKSLDIYLMDVEGGAATLIVTPLGESLLVDSGNPGDRDPARIVRVAKEVAGLSRIDHHIITHWHRDHFGGSAAVSEQLPFGHFYDHGPTVEPVNFSEEFAWYLKLSSGKRTVLSPRDSITLGSDSKGPPLRLVCVCSDRKVLPNRDGSQPTADACDKHPGQAEDKSDNAASVGFKLSFGDFDFLDLGDLTWNIEHRLVCPENNIGVVDVYQTNHHGLANSNNPALVHAVAPTVAVMNNGPRKGGEASVVRTLRSSPGIAGIFQVHRNVRTDESDNAPAGHVANHDENCAGDYVWIKVSPDGKRYRVAAGANGNVEQFASK